MTIFDDMGRFLEERLDEFLKAHPQLELQVLDDKLREQEKETLRLILDLKTEEKKQQDAILATAHDVQRWHERISKAKQAGRQDLVKAAQEREATLLRQGNQQWAHMEVVKQRMQQSQVFCQQIQARRQEVQAKLKERQSQPSSPPPSQSSAGAQGWYQSKPSSEPDSLEATFQQWEIESELDDLKRSMGRK